MSLKAFMSSQVLSIIETNLWLVPLALVVLIGFVFWRSAVTKGSWRQLAKHCKAESGWAKHFRLLLAAPLILWSTGSYAVSSPLCAANEQTLWHCVFKNHKSSALCASAHLTANQGYLQYRFGVPGSIELAFPSSREQSHDAFRYAYYFRYQANYDTVRFTNNGVAYSLASYDSSDGVSLVQTVTLADQKDKEMQCVKKVSGAAISGLKEILKNEEF